MLFLKVFFCCFVLFLKEEFRFLWSGVQQRFGNSKVEELDSGAESLCQLLGAHLWAFEGINSRPPLVRGNQASCLWPERIASESFWGSWQAARGERTENPWLNKHCVFTFHCEQLKRLSQQNWFHMFSVSSSGMTSCISETRQIRCWCYGKTPCHSVLVCSRQILTATFTPSHLKTDGIVPLHGCSNAVS